jgi:hypothetical protein
MTGGSHTNPGDAPKPPPEPADRIWAHPSEVGLVTRGRSDRRRSSFIATGVVIGGLGLLLSGVLLGSGDPVGTVSADSRPIERIERSVATIMTVRDGFSSVRTGLVVDGRGHLVVPADDLRGADEIWVRCHGGPTLRATEIGVDRSSGLGVIRSEKPSGSAPSVADTLPRPGQEVVIARATPSAAVTRPGTVGAEVVIDGAPLGPWERRDRVTTVALEPSAGGTDRHRADDGSLVFDRSGALLGIATRAATGTGDLRDESGAPQLVPAQQVLAAVGRLLDGG